jgi:hypothetical protein
MCCPLCEARGNEMRCLACGEEMQVDQIDPHETLLSCEHYTFRCTSCGDIERRLISRQRVAAAEIVGSRKIVQPLLKPQEKIFRRDELIEHTAPSNMSPQDATTHKSLTDFMKDPRAFIGAFVRNREHKD